MSGYLRTPAWSPDGRRVAFVRFLNGYNEIYIMNADGSHPRRLTGPRQDVIDELSSQAWSPDGRKLVFARGPNMPSLRARPTSIFVINADGTGIRQLTRNNKDDDPAWSPEGRIAFARYGSTNYGSIYVMNSDGSHLQRVATSSGFPTPSWSPNGKELAFAGWNDDIEIVSLKGRKARHLAPSTYKGYAVSYYQPTWSPDGRKLAFVADTDPGQVGWTWIEVSNLAGGQIKALDRGFHGVEYPAWSPKERQIAFDTFGKLELVNINGKSGP